MSDCLAIIILVILLYMVWSKEGVTLKVNENYYTLKFEDRPK